MRKILSVLKAIEYITTIVIIILYTEGVLSLFLTGGANEGDKNEIENTDPENFLIFKILFPLTYIFAIFLLTKIIYKNRKINDILFRNFPVLAVLVFAVFSATWSELPDVSFNRAIALFGTTIFGIYIANRYSLKEQINLLTDTFAIIILLSFVFALFLPQYGIMGGIHNGAWRGIYVHKNGLSKMMVLSAMMFALKPINNFRSTRQDLELDFITSRTQNLLKKKRNWLSIAVQVLEDVWKYGYKLFLIPIIGLSTLKSLLKRASFTLVVRD